MATKRKCSGTTKAGKPCGAPPLKDQAVCLAHADAETRTKAQFLPGGNGKGGRPKNPRVVDILRERLEEHADEVIQVYLDATRAIKDDEPDHAIRLRAVEALNDRAYGKPGQSLEVTGKDGGAIEVNEIAFDDPKVREAADELARRVGSAREK